MNEIFGDVGNDSLDGTVGDDEIFGGAGTDTIYGGEGNDILHGGDETDTLFGGDGDDTFFGPFAHKDIISGGDGIDTLDLSASTANPVPVSNYVIDIDQGASTNGGVSFLIGSYSGLENIISFDTIAIEIIGNASDNILISSNFNDTIRGEDGNDTLHGRDGSDILYGDSGNDTLYGGEGVDTLYGGQDDDTFIMTLESGADDLIGGNGNDTADFSAITGFDMVFDSANQTYAFEAGGDTSVWSTLETVLAGSGDDLFVGSDAFYMTINGGDGVDTLDVSSSPVSVASYGNFVLDIDEGLSINGGSEFIYGDFSNLENVTSFDQVAIRLVGNDAANHLISSVYDDVIMGEGGSDRIEGRDGADTIYGGAGKDKIYGGNDQDQIYGGSGRDKLEGGANKDRLDGGDGSDILKGGRGSDKLIGGNGNDNLNGGKGNDGLYGGDGSDVLQGGQGSDRFVFEEKFADRDVITDFDNADDVIQLDVDGVLNQIISVTNDGADTLITFGATDAEVLLQDVVLTSGDLNFEFV